MLIILKIVLLLSEFMNAGRKKFLELKEESCVYSKIDS